MLIKHILYTQGGIGPREAVVSKATSLLLSSLWSGARDSSKYLNTYINKRT